MKILNKLFKAGVDNPNTSVTPIIVIGNHRQDGLPEAGSCITVSTKYFNKTTMSMDHPIVPMLTDFPTCSNSINILKSEYKVSSLTFEIVKAKFEGKTIHEHFALISNSGLIGQEIGYYLASEHNKYFGDCPKMFSGKIVEIKSRKGSNIKIVCEDISEIVLSKEIPYKKLALEHYGRFSQNPYPMNYGYFIYSPLYSTTSDLSVDLHGVFDNSSAYYGEGIVKGVHFFDGAGEARMCKSFTGLFLRFNKLIDEPKGRPIYGGDQWTHIPNSNQVKFNKISTNGSVSLFADNEFEAEFHFNKTGIRGEPSSNMLFETINISTLAEGVDASASKKFPLIAVGGFQHQTWANTGSSIPPYEFLNVGYSTSDSISLGIQYNNMTIDNVEQLNNYREHYTSENENIRLADLTAGETTVEGYIGFDEFTLESMGVSVSPTMQNDNWYNTGATVGVDCMFEAPPQMSETQRCFFTLEMDMIGRIEHSIFDATSLPFNQFNHPDDFGNWIGRHYGESASGSANFDHPGHLAEGKDTMNMPSQPAMLYWIDSKAAGGWFASKQIVDATTDDNPDHPDWEGVRVKMGQGFAIPGDNLKSLTFSKLDASSWTGEADGVYPGGFIDMDTLWATVLGQGEDAFINDEIYTSFAGSTANLGMFIDATGGEIAWSNEYKDRGYFVALSWSNAFEFKHYLPNELVDAYTELWEELGQTGGIFDNIHTSMFSTYELADTQIFYSERGQSPSTLSINMWDSSAAITHRNTFFNDFYTLPSQAEVGSLWIRGLGYYMIYGAEDFLDTDFYAYLKSGRKIDESGNNAFLMNDFSYDADLIISSPVAVISDILKSELGYEFPYDDSHPKYGSAWTNAYIEHQTSPVWYVAQDGTTQTYSERFKLGFCKAEAQSAKQFLTDIAYQTKLTPYFDGKAFTFHPLKSKYNAVDITDEVTGCTNPYADNYDAGANTDDVSCKIFDVNEIYWDVLTGCMDPDAISYTEASTLFYDGVLNTLAGYYDPDAIIDSENCIYASSFGEDIYGCTDPEAENYNAGAVFDDGSCIYPPGDVIRVEFTLMTTTQFWLFELWDLAGNFPYAEFTVSYSYKRPEGMDFDWLSGSTHAGAIDQAMGWLRLEGGYPYDNLSLYPPKSIIVHPFNNHQEVIGDSPYEDFINGKTLLDYQGNAAQPMRDTNYAWYYQEVGGYYGSISYAIGAGHEFYVEYEGAVENELPKQTSYGILTDSITFEHEERVILENEGFGGGDCVWITRWYTVQGYLPRSGDIVLEQNSESYTWDEFLPSDPYFTAPNSLVSLTNNWIYEIYDESEDTNDLTGLFDYAYIEEQVLDAANNSVNSWHEACNVPCSITIMGLNFNDGDGFSEPVDIVPGSLLSENLALGNGDIKDDHPRATWLTNSSVTMFGNTEATLNKVLYPTAFIQVKSYDENDGWRYSYPNQSMLHARNPGDPVGVGGGYEEYGAHRYKGQQSDLDEYNAADPHHGLPSAEFFNNNIQVKNSHLYSKATNQLIGGTYAPIGIHWWMETPSRISTTSSGSGNQRNQGDVSRIIEKTDVLTYSVSQSSNADVIGRCRVKYAQTVVSGDFERATEWFYWYDIPAIKKYYDDLGQTPSDTTLQDLYNIDSIVAYDEDGEETNYINCELSLEANYINDIHSARALAQYILGMSMNIHTKIDVTVPFKYIDLEIGDVVAIDERLGEDTFEDYGYNEFLSNIEDGVISYQTKLGQTILPLFLVQKVKCHKNMTMTLSMVQIHDWAGLTPYSSDVSIVLGDTPPALAEDPGYDPIYGCTDNTCENYDPDATTDDMSCVNCGEDEEEIVLGDLNGDGNIDVLDVVMAINIILSSGGVADNPAIDLNQDGNADVLDIVMLINLILNS